ncbi:MAG: carboxypeptidase-like regulatory domain-containing protein, partial [Paramuribaculum sp.]|nr:carboxypeptidase-like regulatory domain-containing protein [Paramuribaculum sp.]
MPKQLTKVMLACLLTAGGCYQTVYAQQAVSASQTNGTCTGTVTDSTGEPMVGASVFVVGTNKGTSTDIDGRFSLAGVKEGATLRISSVGYTPINVKWEGQPLSVVLADEGNQLDEVVVVGYGIQKKVNLTGAVATVNGDVLKDRPLTNIGQGLQGVIGNLNVSANNGGAPGATSSFNVRGTTSLNGGGPLVLVDNVQMDPNLVNPNDIESVTVLKDAASAAIYGARAAYGV